MILRALRLATPEKGAREIRERKLETRIHRGLEPLSSRLARGSTTEPGASTNDAKTSKTTS